MNVTKYQIVKVVKVRRRGVENLMSKAFKLKRI